MCVGRGMPRLLPLVLTPEEVDRPSVERCVSDSARYCVSPRRQFRCADRKSDPAMRSNNSAATKLKGLLLDLRNNPGGVVASALETASLFLNPGQTIVSVRGRSVGSDEVKVPEGSRNRTRFP